MTRTAIVFAVGRSSILSIVGIYIRTSPADDVKGWAQWLNNTIGPKNLAHLHDRLHAPINPSPPLL
jgi:hypothetical protein